MAADRSLTAVVFSGGLGLGGYHGGAFEALIPASPSIDWLAGSSAGAITAALIAGSASADRIGTLRSYWRGSGSASAAPDVSRHPAPG
ncbi:patatin-like phospholipase family protein [Bradyrhizobium sacchari]|uniref:patatin-like phospholipase family protein n=1 Tax=Bradyrhizobium sacchari TaxID=1399419 RepID=UPI0032213D57